MANTKFGETTVLGALIYVLKESGYIIKMQPYIEGEPIIAFATHSYKFSFKIERIEDNIIKLT